MSGLREAMVRMNKNGVSVREISRLLSTPNSPVTKSSVQRAIERNAAIVLFKKK